jgi:putative two-component system response regulator
MIMDPRAKILIADDEERNLRLMEAMLTPLGHEVHLARNGREALGRAGEIHPDLILLDIMMPGMDGYQVLKSLKENENTQLVPVVMVTALREKEERVKALEVGADDFLTKPVEKTELRARVRSLLRVKEYHDRLLDHQRELETEVSRRTEQLSQALERLKRSSLETIYRLSRAAEFRDEETSAHLKRMSRYSAVVAENLGLNNRTVESILCAAPMHDVGKIGIPDHILLKPGKLDDDEWRIMKQHTVIGARILEGSDTGFIKLAQIIAYTHHERWNGKGYPEGIAGRAIPLVGRIVAIADVFDALTSRRPYKEPFPVERAFKIIKEERGEHFDPEVVDAFFSGQDEILYIKSTYEDAEEEVEAPFAWQRILKAAQ